MSKDSEGEMCFLNKLLLLAVLGWLFQVGGESRLGKEGRDYWSWRWGECLSLIKVGARRGMGITIVSEEGCLNPETMRSEV